MNKDVYRTCRAEQRIINSTLESIILPLREEMKKKSFKTEIYACALEDAENKCYEHIAIQMCALWEAAGQEDDSIDFIYPDSQAALQCLGVDDDTIEGILRIRELHILDLSSMPTEDISNLLTHYLVPIHTQRHVIHGLNTIRQNCDTILHHEAFLRDSRQLISLIQRLLVEPSDFVLPNLPPSLEKNSSSSSSSLSSLATASSACHSHFSSSSPSSSSSSATNNNTTTCSSSSTLNSSTTHLNNNNNIRAGGGGGSKTYYGNDNRPRHDSHPKRATEIYSPRKDTTMTTTTTNSRNNNSLPPSLSLSSSSAAAAAAGVDFSQTTSPPPPAAAASQQNNISLFLQTFLSRIVSKRSSGDYPTLPNNNSSSTANANAAAAAFFEHHQHHWISRTKKLFRSGQCDKCHKKIKDNSFYQCEYCSVYMHINCTKVRRQDECVKIWTGDTLPNKKSGTLDSNNDHLRSTTSSPAFNIIPRSSDHTPGSSTVSNSPLTPRSSNEIKFGFSSSNTQASQNHAPKIAVVGRTDSIERRNPAKMTLEPSMESSDPRMSDLLRMSSITRDWEIPYEDLIINESIGHGSFGHVYMGWWHGDVVIKILNLDEKTNVVVGGVNEPETPIDGDDNYDSSSTATATTAAPTPLSSINSPCRQRAPPLGRISSWLMYSSVSNASFSESSIQERKRQAIEAFKKEVGMLHKTRHENLVFFMGACLQPPLLAIVTKHSKGDTLYNQLHARRQPLHISQCITIATQVAEGMGYLHARGIVHKDLKSKNIFLEGQYKAVISDFGIFNFVRLSRRQKFGEYIIIPNGWLCYLAPEIIHKLDLNSIMNDTSVDLPFSKHSDVFAFGTVWYELLTMQWPFARMNVESVIYRVGKGMKQPLQHISLPRDFKEILNNCWSFKTSARPEFLALAQQLRRLPRLHRNPSQPVKSSVSKSHENLASP